MYACTNLSGLEDDLRSGLCRLAGHSEVTDYIKSYVAAPLIATNGCWLGALCAPWDCICLLLTVAFASSPLPFAGDFGGSESVLAVPLVLLNCALSQCSACDVCWQVNRAVSPGHLALQPATLSAEV